ATALIAHRLAYAAKRGFTVARFSTASDNVPIHRAARRFGFQRARAYVRYEARAVRGEPPGRARPKDAPAILRLAGPYVPIPRRGARRPPPATGGRGAGPPTSMRSRSGRELDQGLRLVDGDVLAVDVPRVQLRHAHDLVLTRAADLEAAGATQALQLRHRP